MAKDSRRVRKLRRLKREKSLAFRLANQLVRERAMLRQQLAAAVTPKAEPDGQTAS